MRKKSNKGFTLIEVIIAISIFIIVIAMGYRIINETNKATKSQAEIFKQQQGVNLVNKYLTKDLEQCKEFKPADTSMNPYEYIINESTNPIIYKVVKNKQNYSVTRIANGTSVEIINSEVPFVIEKKYYDENFFKVRLANEGSTIKEYEFDISSRIIENEFNNGTTPEIDTNLKNGYIGFEYYKSKGSSNSNKIQITVKGGEDEKITNTQSANKNSIKNEFNIYAEVPLGHDNNGKLGATMNGITEISIGDSSKFLMWKELFGKELKVDNIIIDVSEGVLLSNLTIDGKVPNNKAEYSEGKYYFKVNKTKGEIVVKANMKIIDPSMTEKASVVIRFGKSK